MNFWIGGEPQALAQMLRRIDLLIINDEEARELTGIHNLVRAAADIRKRGPKALVIKRGEFGALMFDDAGVFFVPAYPLEEVLDPTGAGDSFAGGLMGYLAARGEISPGNIRKAMFFMLRRSGAFASKESGHPACSRSAARIWQPGSRRSLVSSSTAAISRYRADDTRAAQAATSSRSR